MWQFLLHFMIIPISIGLAFLAAVIIGRIIMWKNPKFDKWVREMWPNGTQKEAIVTVVVIGLFIWFFIR